MLRLQARLRANVTRLSRGIQPARRPVPETPSVESRAGATAQHVREAGAMTGAGAGKLEMSHTTGRAITLVMAMACGVAAANIYYNQPMLGIMEAAFAGKTTVIGLVPTATQLGFAAGLLLLVPLGDRFERRRLILIQFAALALSLAAAALAPDAWSLVVASIFVGVTSSVAQQIVPFAAELAEPSRRGATIGTVMSGLLCGILFGRRQCCRDFLRSRLASRSI